MKTNQKLLLTVAAFSMLILSGCMVPYDDVGYYGPYDGPYYGSYGPYLGGYYGGYYGYIVDGHHYRNYSGDHHLHGYGYGNYHGGSSHEKSHHESSSGRSSSHGKYSGGKGHH